MSFVIYDVNFKKKIGLEKPQWLYLKMGKVRFSSIAQESLSSIGKIYIEERVVFFEFLEERCLVYIDGVNLSESQMNKRVRIEKKIKIENLEFELRRSGSISSAEKKPGLFGSIKKAIGF